MVSRKRVGITNFMQIAKLEHALAPASQVSSPSARGLSVIIPSQDYFIMILLWHNTPSKPDLYFTVRDRRGAAGRRFRGRH